MIPTNKPIKSITYNGTNIPLQSGTHTSGGVLYPIPTDKAISYVTYNGVSIPLVTSRLPSAYQEVEYLEGTGSQYINTAVNYFADFETTIKLRENVGNYALGISGANCMQRISGANPCWQFSSNGNYNSTIPILEKHTIAWKNNKIYCDGELITTRNKATSTSGAFWLFGAGADTIRHNIIYNAKLYDTNGVKIRDFVPCYKENETPIGENLFDKDAVVRGYELASNGISTAPTWWYIVMPVSPNTTYTLTANSVRTTGTSNFLLSSAEISADGKFTGFISSITGNKNIKITTPSNCRYVAINGTIAQLDADIEFRAGGGSPTIAGMYDIVNDVFYTNAGAGVDFVVGPDVN